MSETNFPDWSTAPDDAEYYGPAANFGFNTFFKFVGNKLFFYKLGEWAIYNDPGYYDESLELVKEMARRQPAQPTDADWPDENRIDVIASNGPTGEHYEKSGLTTAADFLSEGMRILTERGQQYGSGERECSFPQVAQAFNAITGRDLAGSDVCLILALVKQVRQYAQPGRFHEDSAVDGVNYTALQAEQLRKERIK